MNENLIRHLVKPNVIRDEIFHSSFESKRPIETIQDINRPPLFPPEVTNLPHNEMFSYPVKCKKIGSRNS